ncbi:murein hydrolase activator EnvC family protein [Streptomyces sp. cmx-18-6]|uniref:murein hydrolase activator EnvC family protein n=1 Tax=Streptomyces sp. cmx-18-6 TaxID=2790930 RepID=UPI0039804819
MRILLRTPGPRRVRVPMSLLTRPRVRPLLPGRPALACAALLVAALVVAALPPPRTGEAIGARLLPAARAEEPPPPGPDAEAADPSPAPGPAEDQNAEGAQDTRDRATEDADAAEESFAERDGGPVWPLAGRPAVLRGWEPPAGPYGPGHRGVDLAARPGAAVLAAATGRVSFAGPVAGRGVVVVELAGSGTPPLRTTYEPVRALVEKGDAVVAGGPVGLLEAGPFHGGSGCLHWGLRRGKDYLNPLSLLPRSLLRRGPSRLLPVYGVPEPPGTARFGGGGVRGVAPGGAATPAGAVLRRSALGDLAPASAVLSRVRRAGPSRRRRPR